ncbi:unnamed protein product [Echinostoma caproni]|uniref:Uncharacterized protein n=1 Tax=Echinostoma caproni TaxID=27848 RepID=A0A183A446_9TREM|nr:unnamed protein product [Echinostoma caproni]
MEIAGNTLTPQSAKISAQKKKTMFRADLQETVAVVSSPKTEAILATK